MGKPDYDLIVIGGGSGGVRAARAAAGYGAKVAIVEAGTAWGGTCVLRGCVPKKLYVYAAAARQAVHAAAAYGYRVSYHDHDFAALQASVAAEVARLAELYRGGLQRVGVELLTGHARLMSRDTVEVQVPDGTRTMLHATRVLLAVGGRPRHPECEGGAQVPTSDDFWRLTSLPRRVTILGGGYVAAEFASILAVLGAEVELVLRGQRLLPTFDQEVAEHVEQGLLAHGITVTRGKSLSAATHAADGPWQLTYADQTTSQVDWVCAAIGRVPNTCDLGLDAAGVEVDARGHIVVDEASQTTAPSIFAVGDCTPDLALTPVAIARAQAFADSKYGGRPRTASLAVPTSAVFSLPQAASAGCDEASARARYGEVKVFRSTFRPMSHALAGDGTRCLVKLVVDAASDRVVGAHMVGDGAAEIIQMAAIAITAGLTKAQWDATLAIHPTVAEEFVLLK